MPSSGDEDKGITLAAVGAALTAWGHYEAELGRLFTSLVAYDLISPGAERAFGAIRTFEARRDVLRSAGDAYFAHYYGKLETDDVKQDRETFGGMLTISRNAVRVRNNIAHGVVVPYLPPRASETIGFCLEPSYYDSSKRTLWGNPEFAYNADMLNNFALEFGRMCEAPRQLWGSIVARAPTSPEKHRLPIP
jgi:hypothetical protein